MSLSSLLLKSVQSLDNDLDALFTAKPAPLPVTLSTPGSSKDPGKKRKLNAGHERLETPLKRVKSVSKVQEKSKGKNFDKLKAEVKPEAKSPKVKSRSSKGKGREVVLSDNEGGTTDTEDVHLASKAKEATKEEYTDGNDDDDTSRLVHESLSAKPAQSAIKKKYVPVDETPELRDQRTIFVGNLPIEVVRTKPLQKQLQRHILTFVPTAKIESTRFRSIPFQAPTAKLPAEDDESTAKSKTTNPEKQARPHNRERASTWRSNNDVDEEEVKKDDKKFLSQNQKKKIAFINQEFHSTADTINAYIVFAHPAPNESRPSNLPPLHPAADPYESAQIAAQKSDGTLFMERMIRVDLVGKKGTMTNHTSELSRADAKLSIFVGNLDFASKEEDLRVFFEGIVSAERGPPPEVPEDEQVEEETDKGETAAKGAKGWVSRVRIVRDKDTQMGKGFAYVQFADRECVDEVLALEEARLKFAKRKLRVQRCKTLPGTKIKTDIPVKQPSSKSQRPAPVPIPIPKGDPTLGERLAHLPKDARKQAKSTDADRVARRLAKKKARIALGNVGAEKTRTKERERVRKGAVTGKLKGATAGKKDGKKRVRSDKSVAKRNTKK